MRATPDLERLSGLIDFIYRGATEPALWPEIVADAARWLGSPKAMLYTPLHGPAQGGLYVQHGLTDFFLDLYKARGQAVDLWTHAVLENDLFREGRVILGTDVVPQAALVDSAWYADCLRHGDIAHLLTSVVFEPKSPPSGPTGAAPSAEAPGVPGALPADLPTACSFYRGAADAPYGDDDRRRLALLLPHLSRALGVMTRLRLADFQVASSLAALDRLPGAVLLMSAGGCVLFANRAAAALLAAGDLLRLVPAPGTTGLGRLVAGRPAVDREIARALSAARSVGDAAHFSQVVDVPGRAAGPGWQLQISRVVLPPTFHTGDELPEVIAFLTDARRPLAIDVELLRRTYRLTPAEAQVAVAATTGAAVAALAATLGLGVNTLKTHLKNVYAKTGVQGRAELVRVMFGLAAGP